MVIWDRGCMEHSLVMEKEIKLVLGPHSSREARHSPEYQCFK